ncbi:d-lactate dehydrogenase [Fusarium pseudoanthophilum]|uniref:D-lactate dehydrogenase n=1 Tax=Fusarium pseudoanthophilum TaxID=48495 RepID=A0A8H5UPQ5_9HYPO|nr:d-lactate dehydrogenase [Fusarium pseudoanthophilum]
MSNSHTLSSVFQDFIAKHPNIKFTFPGDEAWADVTKCFIKSSCSPSIVARPQDASHVQELVRFCVSHSVDFVVRSGGHDCMGRSQVNSALTIDMRDINHVSISEDKKTAQIGGGIITRELTKALDAEGLITPTPLSTKYGLGVDQIISAQYVNADGELVDAGEEELKAIRGGGGCLGIITQMTVKVYSMKEILEGTFVFESTNKHAAWASFINGYNKLATREDIPNCLSIQLTGVAIPHAGNIFTISCLWADTDHDEGRKWMAKIIALGNCVREVIKTNSWSAYCEEKEKLAGYGVYGRARTLNFKDLTSRTIQILAKYNESIPGPGSLFSMQFHRDPGHCLDSVFSPRCDHYWLEIIATSREEAGAQDADHWALNLRRDLVEHDPENILDSSYLGFVEDGEVDLKSNFGAEFESLMAVKQRVDSGNVFKNTVPRL